MLCLALAAGREALRGRGRGEHEPGPWRGTWTTGANPGYEYQAHLDYTLENSGRVTGQFGWMLVQSPRHEEQGKIGARAVEYVEGEFDIAAGSLTLRGTRKDDPHSIIGLDVYRLAVSPNGQYIVGVTSDNDTWQGRLALTRFGPS
jgi:hypothetical protein